MRTSVVDQIQRQKTPDLKPAVELAAKGRAQESLEYIDRHVREVPDDKARYVEIAREYAAMQEPERTRTLIVSGTNAARRELNALIRRELGIEGTGREFDTLSRKDLTQAERLLRRPERALPLYEMVARGDGPEAEQAQFMLGQTLGRDLRDPARSLQARARAHHQRRRPDHPRSRGAGLPCALRARCAFVSSRRLLRPAQSPAAPSAPPSPALRMANASISSVGLGASRRSTPPIRLKLRLPVASRPR